MGKYLLLNSLISATTFFAANLSAQTQDIRYGGDFSLSELRVASLTNTSHDKGLTAEWLTALWLDSKGLDSKHCTKFFCAAVQARTNSVPPEWFEKRMMLYFHERESEPDNQRPKFDRQQEAMTIKDSLVIPRSLRAEKGWQETSQNSKKMFFLAQSDGTLHIRLKTSMQWDQVSLSEWCAPLARLSDLSANAMSLSSKSGYRPSAFTITEGEEGRIVIYGEVVDRLVICVYDHNEKSAELEFLCTQDMNEAACIVCKEPINGAG